MAEEVYMAAVDLGASGGRVIVGKLSGGRLEMEEVHRFEHRPIFVPDEEAGRWCWNVLGLWEEMRRGLGLAVRRAGRLDSIGIDSWGVDYGLVDSVGRLIRLPVAYRDPRTDKTYAKVIERLGRERIYQRTGIQFMPINTIYQLAADAEDRERPLERAAVMLMIPQLLAYWLTGEKVGEHTLASTTQLYDGEKREWVWEFARELGVPERILPRVVDAVEVIGRVRKEIGEEVRLAGVPVVAVGSHDTASAVAATPLEDEESAYLSSGTWSLLGVELDRAMRGREALEANLTNEAGVNGTTRLLKNVTGLWLVQECRRVWAEEGQSYSYEQLTQWAREAGTAKVWIDPNDPVFATPGNMPERIRQACQRAGGPVPQTPGEVIRCVLESLAKSYAEVLGRIERVSGRRIRRLHVVGGGGYNRLLNELTAQATGREVIVGPYEATAVGNLLVQGMALGAIGSLKEAREIVRRSFALERVGGEEGQGGVGVPLH